MRYITLGLLTAANLAATSIEAGDHCFCTRAPKVCCLKRYDYGIDTRSPIVTGVTFSSDKYVDRTFDSRWATARGRLKSFSLTESRLAIDHCSVSKVAITLEENGNWSANFTARQNPRDVNEIERPRIERFVRNKFYVTLKLFGQYPLATDPMTSELAQPQLAEIEVPAFWLEKGESDNVFEFAECPEVAHYFDVITRIEVDFQYE